LLTQLELAENKGLRVLNKPQSLRDANEKLFASYFPQVCPPTLVSSNLAKITEFIAQFDEAIIRLNMPSADFGDTDGARARLIAERCRKSIYKKNSNRNNNREIIYSFDSFKTTNSYHSYR